MKLSSYHNYISFFFCFNFHTSTTYNVWCLSSLNYKIYKYNCHQYKIYIRRIHHWKIVIQKLRYKNKTKIKLTINSGQFRYIFYNNHIFIWLSQRGVFNPDGSCGTCLNFHGATHSFMDKFNGITRLRYRSKTTLFVFDTNYPLYEFNFLAVGCKQSCTQSIIIIFIYWIIFDS